MTLLTDVKSKNLFVAGAFALALRSVLQHFVDRSAYANDATDFGLGVLFGIGAGLLMIVAWRSGRRLRNQ